MDRDQERLMRETYARVHQLRVTAQQLTDRAEQLFIRGATGRTQNSGRIWPRQCGSGRVSRIGCGA